MLRGRDLLWALAICAALTLVFHYRPLWSARRFVQRQSQVGFVEAYHGHRWIDGQLVGGGSNTGAQWDPLLPPILARSLVIQAENVNWKGDRAGFVVRHIVKLQDGSPGGQDASSEIHVELRKQRGDWRYTRFQVRGSSPMEPPIEGNPWTRALAKRARPFAAHGG
jgi:hypothetical protein